MGICYNSLPLFFFPEDKTYPHESRIHKSYGKDDNCGMGLFYKQNAQNCQKKIHKSVYEFHSPGSAEPAAFHSTKDFYKSLESMNDNQIDQYIISWDVIYGSGKKTKVRKDDTFIENVLAAYHMSCHGEKVEERFEAI